MTHTPTTGQAIRQMRSVAGLTADQLAELAGISPGYLSRVENGKNRPSDRWVGTVLAHLSSAIERKVAEEALPPIGVSA